MKTNSNLLAGLALAASLMTTAAAVGAETQTTTTTTTPTNESSKPCHWWQFHRCDDQPAPIEGLPPEAPRQGTVITVDVSTNTAYLFQDGEMITKSPAATGNEKTLEKGDDMWQFHTPRGHMKVLRKIVDPVWRKPDWAFIEAGDPVPPPNSPKRMVKGHLGKYALDLGDGILIHGTDDIKSIGKRASHGCVRLPEKMLTTVYQAAKVGTDVYIYDSVVAPPLNAARTGEPEHHSDLN